MQHPDEGVIHAWLDGELPADEAAVLEAHIAECADCAALVAEARGLIAASSRIVSSLDIVPGDVIPVTAPRKRAWYANTQLRAAAAVLLVAGASLVVMRGEDAPEMDRLMDQAASAPATSATTEGALPEAPTSADKGIALRQSPVAEPMPAQKKSGAATSMTAPTASAKNQAARNEIANAAKEQPTLRDESRRARETSAPAEVGGAVASAAARAGSVSEEKALQGKVAGGRAAGPPPPVVAAAPAPLAAADAQSRLSRLQSSPPRLDEVVVTGVASVAAEAPLREIKSDTTGSVVTTVYETAPGVQVTLTEVAPQPFAQPLRELDQMRKQRSAVASGNVTVLPAAPAKGTRIETISWTDASTGRTYSLSGPLTKEQLTALRKRLPPPKR